MSRSYILLLLLSILLIATVSTFAFAQDDDEADCVYTFYVKTGTKFRAGTDSIISTTLSDKNGHYIKIENLETWGGLMGPGYDYYEYGHLDIFSGRAPCLPNPICALNLTSDGSGEYPGWYVDYVEVTTAGVHAECSHQNFVVDQWLAIDEPPYELTAVRSNCPVKPRESVGGIRKIV